MGGGGRKLHTPRRAVVCPPGVTGSETDPWTSGSGRRARPYRILTGEGCTYRSEHDSENQPSETPHNDPGRGGAPGQRRQRPERAEEDAQEAGLQELGLPP